jgi:hypothetical protein
MSFFDGFEEWLAEGGGDQLATLEEQWGRIAKLLPEMGDVGKEISWVTEEFGKLGINLKALVLFSMKLAIAKNEPPMSFSSQFTSGFAAGWIGALESQGIRALDQMEEAFPEEAVSWAGDDDDEHTVEQALIMQMMEHPPKGKPLTMEQVGEKLREKARAIGKEFEDPADDWAPVMIVVTDKEMGLLGLDIPVDEAYKNMLFSKIIPMAIERAMSGKPQVVGILTSAWTLDGQNKEHQEWLQGREQHELISDHPDRMETLFLYLSDRKNDEMWTAKILRDGEQAPALASWEKLDLTKEHRNTGRIPKMMRKILS